MNRYGITFTVLAIAALLSACGAATASPAPTATPVPPPSLAPATILPQAAPVALDPCQLVTSQEASALAGTTFGAGLEGSTPGGLKTCVYGSQATNIFTVDVAQAPDLATAQKYKDQFLADLQANLQLLSNQGLNVTQLPNFADGAVLASASISAQGTTFNGSAIGVLKGTIFFGFSDIVVGGAAPTSAALQNQATTVLGRLP